MRSTNASSLLDLSLSPSLSLLCSWPVSITQRGFCFFVLVGEVQRRVNKLVHFILFLQKRLSRVNGTYIERYLYKNSIYENLNQAWRRVIPYVKMMFWQWWIVHYLVRIRMQTQTFLQLRTKKQFWLWKTFCRINSIGVWNSCWVSKQRNVNEKTKSGEESLLSFAHFSVCS